MNIGKALKFIGDASALLIAVIVAINLVWLIGAVATILLALLGKGIGIGSDIFIYVALFCIFYKAWDVVGWIADKIDDRIRSKKEVEG